jgi:hypothetical protein
MVNEDRILAMSSRHPYTTNKRLQQTARNGDKANELD